MGIRGKLVTLELLAGVFGWIWIIASVAGLVTLVGTLIFDWPWSRFFWSVGIAVVSKWLARGFEENKRRVWAEAETRGEWPPPRSGTS